MLLQRKLNEILPGIAVLILLSIASPGHAQGDLNSISEMLQLQKEEQIAIQERLAEIDLELGKTRSEKLDLELDIKKYERTIKKLTIFADDSSSNANELSTAQYKLEVAKIGLKKIPEQESSLRTEKSELSTRLSSLDKSVAELEDELQKIASTKKPKKAKLSPAEEKARKAKQEKVRLAKLERQRKAKEAAEKAAKEKEREERKKQLLAMNAGLSAAEAAINTAKFIGEEPMNGKPVLGLTPELKLANPSGSTPEKIGVMVHLGNNQYMADIVLQKGQQDFYVGDHKYFKMVNKNFDGKPAVFIVDMRDSEQPIFQLFIR